MVDQMTGMERIANSPIPPSCWFLASCLATFSSNHTSVDGIHLKQCVTLYLFALPLTLMNDVGWGAVPIVTVVAFTLMGIEGIANQIEMPFGEHTPVIVLHLIGKRGPIGYDPQDLPLGECASRRQAILLNESRYLLRRSERRGGVSVRP